MSDYYQEMVDEIQAMLASESEVAKAEFTTLAGQYTSGVKEVNARLQTCDRLLRKGHRAEAIRQCEAEPNVLGVVALLDFPGNEQWADLIEQSGIPRPPQLLIDAAADLNEAYTAEQPVAHLMELHRLHALARSPLQVRIGIMRKLGRRDPTNSIWEDDVREFEKVRHRQLADEVKAAGKANDVAALKSLEQEVQSPEWLESPPQPLVTRTVELHARLRRESARAEMEVLEKDLTLAFSNFDVQLGRQLRDRWNACASVGALRDDDPLLEMTAPALDWLEEQDRQEQARSEYDSTIASLEHALDNGQSRAHLERLYHAAVRYEWDVPDILKRRLAERFRELDLAAGRRFRLALVGIVMAVLLLGALTGFGIFHHQRKQEMAKDISTLEQLIQEGRYEEAGKYLDIVTGKWPPTGPPGIDIVRNDLRERVRAEETRKTMRRRYLEEAQNELATAKLGYFGPAYKAVEQARELATTAGEMAEVEQVSMKIRERERGLKAKVEGAFDADLADWQERVVPVLSGDQPDLDLIRALADEGMQLKARRYIPEESKTPIDLLIRQLQAKEDSERRRRHMESLLAQITAAVGDRQHFARVLEAYVEKHPETTRAVDFKRVVEEEAELWEKYARWDRLIGKWSQLNLQRVTPGTAASLTIEGEALLADHGDYPAAEALNELLLVLQAVVRRHAGGGSLHQSLHQPLHNRLLTDLQMVQTVEGKRYYFTSKPLHLAREKAWVFRYVIDFGLTATARVQLSEDEIANPRVDDSFDWTAPQARFSDFALDKIVALDLARWESTFHALLVRLHDEPMEPILQFQLMRSILGVACQGSHCLERVYGQNLSRLEDAAVNLGANWLDPDDTEGGKARDAARRTLASLDDAKAAADAAAQYFAKLNHPVIQPHFPWVGWLCRVEGDNWTCLIRQPEDAPASADLLVFYRASAGDAARFHKVGTFHEGTATVSSDEVGLLVEGRPVFARTTEGPAP